MYVYNLVEWVLKCMSYIFKYIQIENGYLSCNNITIS